jgi:integral membrane protein
MTGAGEGGTPKQGRIGDLAVRLCLRTFQGAALAEGGLLPAILVVAVIHWVSGQGRAVVAVVGATHGAVFTLYLLLTPVVFRILHWPARTLSVAISVAFVPFATWAFERRVRPELTACLEAHRRLREQGLTG